MIEFSIRDREKGLTNLEIKVLERLVLGGPLTGYDFHLGGKRIRGVRQALMSSGSWERIKKSLTEKDLLHIIQTRKGGSHDRGRRRNLYKPSFKGLVFALRLVPELWDHLDTIGMTFSDECGLVFGKWEWLVAQGLQSYAVRRLRTSVSLAYDAYRVGDEEEAIKDGFIQTFYSFFYDLYEAPEYQEQNIQAVEWLTHISQDEDVRDVVAGNLGLYIHSVYQQTRMIFRFLRGMIRNLDLEPCFAKVVEFEQYVAEVLQALEAKPEMDEETDST